MIVVLIYKLIRFTLKSNYSHSVGVLSRVIINAQFLPCRYLFNNLFNLIINNSFLNSLITQSTVKHLLFQ